MKNSGNRQGQGNNDAGRERILDLDAGRRAFIRSAGLAAAGMAALGGIAVTPSEAEAQKTETRPTEADVLNFALNLEYLEAEFYLRAVFGRGLPASDITGTGRLGAVVGGRRVPFQSSTIRQYGEEIAIDELAHVRFLRAALGSSRVARPAIDLASSFTYAARAAGLVGPNGFFDAYADENSFLLAAFIFEDVGVTAYKGSVRFLKTPAVLESAAGILAVEAYHAGNIRSVLFSRGLVTQTQKLSDLRDAVDGSSEIDQGIARNGRANIVLADSNGLAYSRSAQQVLNIVYLGGAANRFGFFPARTNGFIR